VQAYVSQMGIEREPSSGAQGDVPVGFQRFFWVLLPSRYTLLMSEEKSLSSRPPPSTGSALQGLTRARPLRSSCVRKTSRPSLCEGNKGAIVTRVPVSPLQTAQRYQRVQRRQTRGDSRWFKRQSAKTSSDCLNSRRYTTERNGCPYSGVVSRGLTWALWMKPVWPVQECVAMKTSRPRTRRPRTSTMSPRLSWSSSRSPGLWSTTATQEPVTEGRDEERLRGWEVNMDKWDETVDQGCQTHV